MQILVTNPTGRIGSKTLPELIAPEFSVRVLARDPGRLPREILHHVEVVCGSADDPAALEQALEGVEALFWCVPTESLRETDVLKHYERFACAGWKAIRQAGTPRVVTISAGGKGRTLDAGPISGLHAMEDILNESGAALRHLRCGLFMEDLLPQLSSIQEQGSFSYPMPGDIAIPVVAVSDVADTALRWLVRRDWSGIEGVDVHGAEDLCWNQVAAVLEQVLQRPLRYGEASARDYARRLVECGATPEYGRSQVRMFSALAQGILRAEPGTPQSRTPTTLAAWARRELLPAMQAALPQSNVVAGAARFLSPHFQSNGSCNFSRSEFAGLTGLSCRGASPSSCS